jgi:hypothetical protein
MQGESRVQRWRKAKRQHGLKAVTIWLSEEEEVRLKDLALQEHCSPSSLMQRALTQYTLPPQHSSPPDTSLIRKLILEELAAIGIHMPVTVGHTVGPTEIQSQTPTRAAPPAEEYTADHGHSLVTESASGRRSGRPRSALGQQILDLLADHPDGLTAEQLRGYLTPGRSIGDILGGMKQTGTVTTQKEGRALRYFLA